MWGLSLKEISVPFFILLLLVFDERDRLPRAFVYASSRCFMVSAAPEEALIPHTHARTRIQECPETTCIHRCVYFPYHFGCARTLFWINQIPHPWASVAYPFCRTHVFQVESGRTNIKSSTCVSYTLYIFFGFRLRYFFWQPINGNMSFVFCHTF